MSTTTDIKDEIIDRSTLATMTMSEIERRLVSKKWRMNNLYYIIDEFWKRIPFVFNTIQERIHTESKGFKKVAILKYRQWWVSTYKIIDLVDSILFSGENKNCYFVTHRQDLLDEFFKKAKFTYDSIEPMVKLILPKPKTNNSNELYFPDNNNTIKISLDVRGKNPTDIHISELAWMTPEKQKELYLAMNEFREARITIETTANWMGDTFYELCMSAKNGDNEYKLLFYPFDIEDRNEIPADNFEPNEDELLFYKTYLEKYGQERGYRKLAWRRMKINTAKALWDDWEKLFDQENPVTIEHAFISSGSAVFDLTQEFKIIQPIHEIEWFKIFLPQCDQLVIGIDIAEGWKKWDFSTISGRRREDGKIAFTFKWRVNEIILAQKLDFILNYKSEDWRYYQGLIFPENNTWLAFINECKSYKWFQFVLKARKIDDTTDDNLVQKYWFRTTKQSKDLIIREYRWWLYRKEIWITPEIYSEIRTYQFDKENRPNAVAPNHDDLLMADMIAYNAVLHESWVVNFEPEVKSEEDMTVVERFLAKVKRWEYMDDYED